jgi:hypothetical protein
MVRNTVDLYWLPLGAGAGNALVRFSGRLYERLAAWRQSRARQALYHSALVVEYDGCRFVIEMAPVWSTKAPDRGAVAGGAVGMPWLGRSRLFRYEVRCWPDGSIDDIAHAVDSPQRLSADHDLAARVIQLAPSFPTATWGLDEQHLGEMWNSNSLVSWLLAVSGHDTSEVRPPPGGRAPGWDAGLVRALSDLSTLRRR